MRWALTVLLLWFALITFAGADTVRLATYNLKNYLTTNRYLDGVYRLDYPKPESEKIALRTVIKAADADILAIQEIGDERFLKELQADLKREGIDYPHTALMEADDDTRRTAVLSKIPLAKVISHTGLEFTYFGERKFVRRGLLEVQFITEGKRWSLFNVHLLSRHTVRSSDPESREYRTKEALVIRNLIRKKLGEVGHYFIVGDFNDHINSDALRRFREVSDRPLTIPIDAKDTAGMTWTYYWDWAQSYQRVDFILASVALLPKVKGSGIIDHPKALQASDHRLVYVDVGF